MSGELLVVRAGTVPYERARAAQREIEAARQADSIPDVLLLLEHSPVYTRGRRSADGELPMGVEWYAMQGIEVCETDRGGRVTYHGPGQLVAYPIVSLKPYGDDVHAYVRRLERAVIAAIGDQGVAATTIEGLTGVWTAGVEPLDGDRDAGELSAAVTAGRIRKIGSIGVHVSRGVTTHGLAVNVSNDLQPFEWIVPCGIDGCRMTSLSRELGSRQEIDAFATSISGRFAEVYEREPVEIAVPELERRVDGAAPLAERAGAGALR